MAKEIRSYELVEGTTDEEAGKMKQQRRVEVLPVRQLRLVELEEHLRSDLADAVGLLRGAAEGRQLGAGTLRGRRCRRRGRADADSYLRARSSAH